MDLSNIENLASTIIQSVGAPQPVTAEWIVKTMVTSMSAILLPKMNEIGDRVVKLEESAARLETALTTINDYTAKICKLEAECESLKKENEKLLAQAKMATSFALDNKRYSYQYNLLLHGIDEDRSDLNNATDARDPNFRAAVLKELQQFDPTVTDGAFEKAHRLGPPKPQTEMVNKPAPRAIVIKFYNRYVKEHLLNVSIQRYRDQKASGHTRAAQHMDTTAPYLTSHRVRDPFTQQPVTEIDVEAADDLAREKDGQQRSVQKRRKPLRSPRPIIPTRSGKQARNKF